jgi:hypothetical protein
MTKGVWLGGVLLALGGWVGQLHAQTPTWSPSPGQGSSGNPSRFVPYPLPPTGWQPAASNRARGQAPEDSAETPPGRITQFASDRNIPLLPPVAQAADPGIVLTSGSELVGVTSNSELVGVPLPPIGSAPSPQTTPVRSPSAALPPQITPALAQPPALVLDKQDLAQTTLPLVSPAAVAPAPVPSYPTSIRRTPTAGVQVQTSADQPLLPRPSIEPPVPQASTPPVDPALSFHPHLEPGEPWDDPAGRDNFYIRAEYLLWWIKNDHVPPLFTTSNPADMGVLGAPSTQVLFEGPIDRNPFSGARLTAGFWLDCDHETALEFEGFLLGQQSANFSANSSNFPVISRPFFDVVNDRQAVERLAFPGLSTGTGSVTAPSSLWGIAPDVRCKLCCGCDYQIDTLIGLRYLDLTESIQINENIMATAAAPAPFTNANASLTDYFGTRNQFVGGEVGLAGEKYWGPWFVDFRATLALGATDELIVVNGSQQIINRITGQVQNFQGGLLALNSNIGRYSHDRFAVVPELNFHLGYQITEHIRASIGYDFLYWSSVVRPGDQIDTVLDVNRIPNFIVPPGTPTVNRPAVPFKDTDFFATGLTFSLEFTF